MESPALGAVCHRWKEMEEEVLNKREAGASVSLKALGSWVPRYRLSFWEGKKLG